MSDAVTDTHALIWYLENSPRLGLRASQIYDELQAGTTGLVVIGLTAEVVDTLATIPRNIVPDMPDRIVAATALHLGLPLLTQDRAIQQANLDIIW